MIGTSYPGTTPNAAAVEQPPHLKTIVPVSGISRWYGYSYQQGVRATISGEDADPDPPLVTPPDFMLLYSVVPGPQGLLAAPGQIAARWNLCDRVRQALAGLRPAARLRRLLEGARLPAARRQACRCRSCSPTASRTSTSRPGRERRGGKPSTFPSGSVLGQWPHAYPGGLDPTWQDTLERWFARWLYDVPNGIENEPRVRVQGNDGVWRVQDDWGPAATTPGATASVAGRFAYFDDGLLTESEMVRGIGERRPALQAHRARRARPALASAAGRSSRFAPPPRRSGTHFVATLADHGPERRGGGRSPAGCSTRATGAGSSRAIDLVPGRFETMPVELIDKEWVVLPGHRLELLVASSNSTWGLPDERRAFNTLDLAGSWLELPVY